MIRRVVGRIGLRPTVRFPEVATPDQVAKSIMSGTNVYYKLFEQWGTERVRAELLAKTIATHMRDDAVVWLAQRGQEVRLVQEASNASERRRSQRIEIATYVAAIAAIIAAIAAIIPIVSAKL
jgi:hypothetical protein